MGRIAPPVHTFVVEAKIILINNKIIKDRIKKGYRLPELDKKIIKQRTKAETKLLTKASEIINTPLPKPQKEFDKITMPFIDGKKLSEHLNNFPQTKQKQICKQIGESIAKLHDNQIIHGDLTTSNMILVKDCTFNKVDKINKVSKKSINYNKVSKSNNSINKKISTLIEPLSQIFFIDFGLGFISRKFEDKAVDLHLLKQALEAKHFKNWEQLWKAVESGYKKSKDSKIVFERLKAVEKRGRYKH